MEIKISGVTFLVFRNNARIWDTQLNPVITKWLPTFFLKNVNVLWLQSG